MEIARGCTCIDIGQEPIIFVVEIGRRLFRYLVKVIIIWRGVLLIIIYLNRIRLVAIVRWSVDRLK